MTGFAGMFMAQATVVPMSVVDTTLTRASSKSVKVTPPAAALAGDEMYVLVGGDDNDTWTPDAAFTTRRTFTLTSSSYGIYSYVLTSGDLGHNFKFEFGKIGKLSAVCVIIRKGAFDVAGAAGALASPTVAPSVTLSASGLIIVMFCSSISGTSFSSITPSGFTLQEQELTSSYPSMSVLTKFVGSGATGTVTATPSSIAGEGVIIGVKAT